MVEKFDDEFLKALQRIKLHSGEYLHRLHDEPALLKLAARTSSYQSAGAYTVAESHIH